MTDSPDNLLRLALAELRAMQAKFDSIDARLQQTTVSLHTVAGAMLTALKEMLEGMGDGNVAETASPRLKRGCVAARQAIAQAEAAGIISVRPI